MKHQEEVEIPREQRIVTHEVAPCINCGSDDLKIHEYDDQYGYITTITCKKCKANIRQNYGVVSTIKVWNKNNDISLVLAAKVKLIEKTKQEINELKVLQRGI